MTSFEIVMTSVMKPDSLLILLHKEFFRIKSRATSCAGCRHCLTITRIRAIARRKDSLHVCVGSGSLHLDISLFVHIKLTLEDLRVRTMTDCKEEAIDSYV